MATEEEKGGPVLDENLVYGHPYVIDPETGERATLDGVPYAEVEPDDIAAIEAAKRQQAEMQIPLLAGKDNPNAFVFFAMLDGTGNDRHDQEYAPTGVGQIYEQLKTQVNAGYGGGHIAAAYVTGAGTRAYGEDLGLDLAAGYSSNDRAETMYVEFCKQAQAWLKENPNAEISIASMGFSRGAEEAVLLSQLVEKRGIRDPASIDYDRRADGLVDAGTITFDYSIEPLVEPADVAQVVIPIDPVAEGQLEDPMLYSGAGFVPGGPGIMSPEDMAATLERSSREQLDYGIPPSVAGVFMLQARDETRRAFTGTDHIPDGLTDGSTRASFELPGAHSDLGDGYYANGLGVRYTNMVKNYANNLVNFDTPLLTLNPEDPNLGLGSTNVIHDSEKHPAGPLPGEMVYDEDAFRDDGKRDNVAPSRPYEPMDPALTSDVEYRKATIAVAPVASPDTDIGIVYDAKEEQQKGCALVPPAIEVASPSNYPSSSEYNITSTIIDAACETGAFPVEKTAPAPPLLPERVMATDAYGTPMGMYPPEVVPADRVSEVGLPMNAPTHTAFPMYSEAWNAMADPAKTNIPSGNMSENDRARAAAAVTAAAMTGPPILDHIDTVFLNKSNDALIAIEGDPMKPASKRVTVPLAMAVTTPVEDSTIKANAALEEQDKKASLRPETVLNPTVVSTRAQ
jgi:hypothetical protein